MEDVVLGIDFGTTNSVVAVCRPGEDAEVLPNDIGNRITPSCVHLSPSQRQVGEGAVRLAVSDPLNTIRNVKQVLGRTKDDVLKEEFLKPIVIGNAVSGQSCFTLCLANFPRTQSKFMPEEVAGVLLLELKRAAEVHLGHAVKKAVIAVPSYFNAAQRRAVIDSAELAGFEDVRLLNETTAAALSYANDRDGPKTVVIVDIGGGGGSLSKISIEKRGHVKVLASSSSRLPGGKDFDQKMVDFLLESIHKDFKKFVTETHALEIIRSNWEREKHKLSRIPKVTIATFLHDIDAEFRQDVTRSKFESLCDDLFERIARELKNLVKDLRKGATSPQVDEVVLVGGSTRIPKLRTIIEESLGCKLCKAVNPDEAVACGAALFAAKRVFLDQEVTSLSTIITQGENRLLIEPMRILPARKSLVPHNKGYMKVEQGVDHKDGELSTLFRQSRGLGRAHFIQLDTSGVLTFLDYQHNAINDVCFIGCLPSKTAVEVKWRMEEQWKKEAAELKRVELKNSFEHTLRGVLNAKADDSGDILKQAKDLEEECREMLLWLQSNPESTKKEIETRHALIQSKIKALDLTREEAAAELRRKETGEQLKRTLQDAMNHEVDSADENVHKLFVEFQSRILNHFEWLGENQNSSEEAFNSRRTCVEELIAEYLKLREEHFRKAQEAELQRVKARDLLKNELSEVLNTKILADDSGDILKQAKDLEEQCREMLQWLQSNSESTKEEIETRHALIQSMTKALDLAREEAAAELRRKEALEQLKRTLQDAMNLEGNRADENVQKLYVQFQSRILNHFKWLGENQNSSEEAFNSRRICVDELIAEYHKLREEHFRKAQEAESQRVKARDLLKNELSEVLHTKILVTDLAFAEATTLQGNCREELQWLSCNVNEPLPTYSEKTKALQYLRYELDRIRAYRSLKNTVLDIMSVKIDENDPVHAEATEFSKFCFKIYNFLKLNDKVSCEEIQQKSREIKEKKSCVMEARKIAGEARMKLKKKLQSVLDYEVSEHDLVREDVLELRAQCQDDLKWLQTHPQASLTELLEKINSLDCRCHGLEECRRRKREERDRARDRLTNLLHQWAPDEGFKNYPEVDSHVRDLMMERDHILLSLQKEPLLTEERLNELYENFSKKSKELNDKQQLAMKIGKEELMEKKMHLVTDGFHHSSSGVDNGDVHMEEPAEPPSTSTAMNRLLQQATAQRSRPWTLEVADDAVLLQCLADQVAVQALEAARETGYMALLLDAEVTDEHELLALSVRYVPESSEPVEQLLIVQEVSDNKWLPHGLFDQFQKLCCLPADHVDWRRLLCGISLGNSGRRGQAVLELFRKTCNRDIPQLWSSAAGLDSTVASACYASPVLGNFFCTIDNLRDLFRRKRMARALQQRCPSVRDNTWLTYGDSVRFLLKEKEAIMQTLQSNTKAFELRHILGDLNNYDFDSGLLFFNYVFEKTNKFSTLIQMSVKLSELRTWPRRMLLELDGLASSLSFDELMKTRRNNHRLPVYFIAQFSMACFKNLQSNLQFLCNLMDNQECPSSCDSFCPELEELLNSSPDYQQMNVSDFLKPSTREHFKEWHGAVYSPLLTALTMPLFPCSVRSLDLLREGASAAAGCPPDQVGHFVVLRSLRSGAFPVDVERASQRLQREAKSL